MDDSNYALSKPSPREALFFALERFPKELYAIIQRLPFGCHAWRKYEYESFWREVIGNENSHNEAKEMRQAAELLDRYAGDRAEPCRC